MSYAGDPSLTADVQERISSTFQQTLDFATQGKDREAVLGCEFILGMDPEFAPASRLLARLKGSERPVAVDDLTTDRAAPEVLEDLENLEAPGQPSAAATAALPPPPPAAPAAASSGLAAVVQDLLQKRSFEQILQIADKQEHEVAKDPTVQKLVDEARSRLESDAYVRAFVKSAAQARDAGQLEEMESFLAKAGALDPEHPEVLGFSKQPQPAAAAAATAAAAGAASAAPAAADLAAADDDLAILQQQSLELDAGEAEDLPDLDSLDDLEIGDLSFEPDAEPTPLEAADLEVEPDAEPAPLEVADLEVEPAEDDILAGFEAPDDALAEAVIADGSEAEADDRIAQLLAEGQEIFDSGEYQGAIDVWSRIFLIDIDHAEASNRIEQARSKKAELERQAEEIFHAGVAQIEDNALDDAQETLRRVLELQPSHTLAGEYLEQLEAGQVPAIRAAGEAEAAAELEGIGEGFESEDEGQSMEAAVERDRVVVIKKTDKRLIAAGGLVALLVIGGIYFLATGGLDDLFPNRQAPPPVVRVDPIERATKMHEGGNTENAIILLERIQPQDPSYEDAQALIAQWKAHVETPMEETPIGPSREQIERFELLLDAARQAHAESHFIRAGKYFERAGKIAPLSAEALSLKRQCEQALRPLEEEIGLFEDGEYARLIPMLWRRRESDPGNPDVELLLVNSYYNFALTDLQRGNSLEAAKKLQEALEVQPGNEEIERMRLFAQTYVDRPRDLLYRIFVKYLPSRS